MSSRTIGRGPGRRLVAAARAVVCEDDRLVPPPLMRTLAFARLAVGPAKALVTGRARGTANVGCHSR
ncbi:hypothetical protein ABZZ74_19115 [Streptomyces sp. NPDC006476]|uniref:hypothetical protein n=1 Tax=Streptomyces sp. NPDC006476 TaxID=3157175 RepID=UPI0033BC95DA